MVVLLFQLINEAKKDIPTVWDTLFIIFSRPLFIIGTFFIIFPCVMGYGVFASFTKHPFWLPFARLTYGVFLCHSIFILFREYSVERGQWASYFDTWLFFCAYFMLSYAFSLFTFLLVEAPFMQIEADFLWKDFLDEQQ